METLFTSRFETPIGALRIASSEKGLAYIELPNESGRGFGGWCTTHAKGAKVIDRRTPNDVYIDQIMEYAEGSRREFELELDMRATPFQKSVYEFVSKIGYGEICAYSDIANAIGNPKAVRAVGAANGANPIPLIVPCPRDRPRRRASGLCRRVGAKSATPCDGTIVAGAGSGTSTALLIRARGALSSPAVMDR